MDKHFKAADYLTKLLDNQFSILGFKFGLDPLIGVIPWIGDAITFALSGYIIWVGYKMNIPQEKLVKMVQNAVTDLVLGIIPVVGDVSDFVYKSNSKNMKILREYKNLASVIDGEFAF